MSWFSFSSPHHGDLFNSEQRPGDFFTDQHNGIPAFMAIDGDGLMVPGRTFKIPDMFCIYDPQAMSSPGHQDVPVTPTITDTARNDLARPGKQFFRNWLSGNVRHV